MTNIIYVMYIYISLLSVSVQTLYLQNDHFIREGRNIQNFNACIMYFFVARFLFQVMSNNRNTRILISNADYIYSSSQRDTDTFKAFNTRILKRLNKT